MENVFRIEIKSGRNCNVAFSDPADLPALCKELFGARGIIDSTVGSGRINGLRICSVDDRVSFYFRDVITDDLERHIAPLASYYIARR